MCWRRYPEDSLCAGNGRRFHEHQCAWLLAPEALPARPGAVLDPPVPDIVDIKPANMEELTEVITAAEFHPHHCNSFVYSSSKGTIRLCDMRASALCDRHSKCE